jgi:hypothetical protein
MNGILALTYSPDIPTLRLAEAAGVQLAQMASHPEFAGPSADRLYGTHISPPRGGRSPRTVSHIPVRIVGGHRETPAR